MHTQIHAHPYTHTQTYIHTHRHVYLLEYKRTIPLYVLSLFPLIPPISFLVFLGAKKSGATKEKSKQGCKAGS